MSDAKNMQDAQMKGQADALGFVQEFMSEFVEPLMRDMVRMTWAGLDAATRQEIMDNAPEQYEQIRAYLAE